MQNGLGKGGRRGRPPRPVSPLHPGIFPLKIPKLDEFPLKPGPVPGFVVSGPPQLMTDIYRKIWRRLCVRSATAGVMYAYLTGRYYLGEIYPVWVI